MKRIMLFVATNLAVLLTLSVVIQLLGVERILDERGIGLDLRALLVMSLVFGMGGSLLSLAISKWSAKRLTGARVIERVHRLQHVLERHPESPPVLPEPLPQHIADHQPAGQDRIYHREASVRTRVTSAPPAFPQPTWVRL